MELFFDYACPYCYRGHQNLLELIADFPNLEIIWKPCEAHPRPEKSSVHSDMAIQGMYYLEETRGDLWKYHMLIYKGHFEEKKNLSNLDFLADCGEACGADRAAFLKALKENRYADKVTAGNIYAWGDKELNAVPSYLSGNKFIGSHNGVLVTREELKSFLLSI